MATKRAKTTPEIEKFKQIYADSYSWGYSFQDSIAFRNHKSKLEDFYNHIKPKRGKYIPPTKVPNYAWQDHFNKKLKIYYVNKLTESTKINGFNKTLLIMIDIDIKKSQQKGTKEGALAFAKRLKREFGRKLYIEPSTSGSSYHGYIRINVESYRYPEIKDALSKFETYLTGLSKRYDIELVELKGHPFCATKDDAGKVSILNMGQLAKVPFALKDPNESRKLFNTTKITISQILDGKYSPKEQPASINEVVTQERLENSKSKPVKNGSHGTKFHFPTAYLDNMKRFAKAHVALFGADYTINRWYFAIAVGIMIFVKHNRIKKDRGSYRETSVALYKLIWDRLYQERKVNKSYSQNLFCRLKADLSKRGFIKWIDNTYAVGSEVGTGKATTWLISDSLEEMLLNTNYDLDEDLTGVIGSEEHKECIRVD